MKITAWTNEEYARKNYIDPIEQRLNLYNPDKKLITPIELHELADLKGQNVEDTFEQWQYEYDKIPTYTDEEKAQEYAEIEKEMETTIIKYCKEKGIRFDSVYHQYGEFGIPIFDNKYMFMTFARTWGWIMAQADGDKSEQGYLRYYLHGNEINCVYPNEIGEVCL